MRLLTICTLSILLLWNQRAQAQGIDCPTNVDFETGTYTNWNFFTGSCCPINTPTNSGPLANRHVLTNGPAVDPYGNFPVVAPGGGTYSLKLGNNGTGAQAEKHAIIFTYPPVSVISAWFIAMRWYFKIQHTLPHSNQGSM